MQWWAWLLISLGVFLAIYAAFLAWLVIRGRREDPRALATFMPDCIVLVTASHAIRACHGVAKCY